MASVILRTTGLTKTFGGLTANEDVDFALPEGQVHALIGPNGAGKSTFVGMVSGRIAPTSGRVEFQGRDVTDLPAHARMQAGMAYTFQITAIYAKLTLAQNLALALGRDDPKAIRHALDRVGLSEPAHHVAGDLSYGHQRLLEIAMGVAQEPKLLILDEPTQGLSESEIAGFNTLIRDLAGNATILLIEHNMDVVMALADEITVLDQGRVLASGTPEAIRADTAVQDAYLGGG